MQGKSNQKNLRASNDGITKNLKSYEKQDTGAFREGLLIHSFHEHSADTCQVPGPGKKTVNKTSACLEIIF